MKVRDYQKKIIEIALKENTIVFLPTGSGKTLIAVEVIKHHLSRLAQSSFDKKIIAFVAPTKVLVSQQVSYIRNIIDDPAIVIRAFTGESSWMGCGRGVKFPSILPKLMDVDVLAMTPEILRQIFQRGMLPVSAFQLIVLDECHHAVGKHPMAIICEIINSYSHNRPSILGLTASPLSSQKGSLDTRIRQLECTTGCKMITSSELMYRSEIDNCSSDACSIWWFEESSFEGTVVDVITVISNAVERLKCVNQLYSVSSIFYYIFGENVEQFEFDSLSFLLPYKHVFDIVASSNFSFSPSKIVDYIQSLSHVSLLFESCGAFAALFGLKMVLECFVGNECIQNFLGDASLYHPYELFRVRDIKISGKKRSFKEMSQYVSTIDIEMLEKTISELVGSKFSLLDLVNMERCIVQSLLEILGGILYVMPNVIINAFLSIAMISNEDKRFFSILIDQVRKSMESRLLFFELSKSFISQELTISVDIVQELVLSTCYCLLRAIQENSSLLSGVVLPCCESTVWLPGQTVTYERKYMAQSNLFMTSKCSSFLFLLFKELERLLLLRSSSSELSMIVFCKMRLLAMSLKQLFSFLEDDHIRTNILCGGDVGGNSVKFSLFGDYLIGGDNQNSQLRTLLEFKNGIINVLFATDVAEEGLDIKACQVVINFDFPVTLKSFVQRRGRARAEDSKVIVMLPYVGQHSVDDLMKYNLQEMATKEIALENGKDISDECFIPFGSYSSDEGSDDEKPEEDEKEENSSNDCENQHDSFLDTSTRNLIEIEGDEQYIDNDVDCKEYVIERTGAKVDILSSVKILSEYCQQLSRDSVFSPKPIFWVSPISCLKGSLYQCSLLLPPSVDPLYRCYVGRPSISKFIAKSSVSLEALKCLHRTGEINDWFLSSRGKMDFRSETSKILLPSSHSDLNSSTDIQLSSESLPSGSAKSTKYAVFSKTVPDVLLPIDNGIYEFHFYVSRASFVTKSCQNRVAACKGCCQHFKGINNVGLSLRTKLSSDLLDYTSRHYIRDRELIDRRIEYLGSKIVSNYDLLNMQRFHRALLCWESDMGLPQSSIDDENQFKEHWTSLDDVMTFLNSQSQIPMNGEEWSRSSNGSYYVLYPIPEVLEVKDDMVVHSVNESDLDLSQFTDSVKWSDYLKKCAGEAQMLVTNFLMQEKISSTPYDEYKQQFHNDTFVDLDGWLVSKGPGSLLLSIPSNCGRSKTVNSELVLRKRKDAPTDNENFNLILKKSIGNLLGEMIASVDFNSGVYENLEVKSEELEVLTVFNLLDELVCSVEIRNSEDQCIETIISYSDFFVNKFPHLKDSIIDMKEKNQEMTELLPINSRLTFFPFSNRRRNKPAFLVDGSLRSLQTSRRRLHGHSNTIYSVPQFLVLLGKGKWFYAGLSAPIIMWRIQSLLLAQEARNKLLQIMKSEILISSVRVMEENDDANCLSDTMMFGDINSNISFDVTLPKLSLILEAITPRMCRESFDSERLEVLGDSLLKLIVSVELFRCFPSKNEGFLTLQRTRFISNMFLTEAAKKFDVDSTLRLAPISRGVQELYYRPPGLLNETKNNCLWNKNITVHKQVRTKCDPEKSNCLSFNNETSKYQYSNIVVNPKLLADVIEALLGAFYLSGGLESGQALIHAFGAWPKTETFMANLRSDYSEIAIENICRSDSSPVTSSEFLKSTDKIACANSLRIPDGYPEVLRQIAIGTKANIVFEDDMTCVDANGQSPLLDPLDEKSHIEATSKAIYDIFGYNFIDLNILEESLTHCSVAHKASNQRLEFMGDAVLDFVVVSLLYKKQQAARQGDLCYQKMNATNNVNLAIIGLKLGLFKHLRHRSSILERDFTFFESKFDSHKSLTEEDIRSIVNEKSSSAKTIADVFEAIIGGIFVDCKGNLTVVIDIVKGLNMLPQLDDPAGKECSSDDVDETRSGDVDDIFVDDRDDEDD